MEFGTRPWKLTSKLFLFYPPLESFLGMLLVVGIATGSFLGIPLFKEKELTKKLPCFNPLRIE